MRTLAAVVAVNVTEIQCNSILNQSFNRFKSYCTRSPRVKVLLDCIRLMQESMNG